MLSNGPLPAQTFIPTNIPGPIRPGIGPGSWHVGPKVVREGRLPYGTYSNRMRQKDARLRTYGNPEAAGGVVGSFSPVVLVAGMAASALTGGIAGAILPGTTFGQGMLIGLLSNVLTVGGAVVLANVIPLPANTGNK